MPYRAPVCTPTSPGSTLTLGQEEVDGRGGLGSLLRTEVDAAVGQVDLGLRDRLEHLSRAAFGRQLRDARPIGIQPQLDHERSPQLLRRLLELERGDGERHELVELHAVGSVRGKNLRWPEENNELTLRLPSVTDRTSFLSSLALEEAEQTYAPGIASTSTPNSGSFHNSAGGLLGMTGRNLITVSSGPRWVRRARPTRPLLLTSRSGVSKNTTWRSWAFITSRPSASAVGRYADSATVSLSSTVLAC